MATSRDKNGRPIVVVTGMGVVTSLGAGKADNWAKLTAGQSGIRASRVSHRGPQDHDRRHRRFRAGRAVLLDRARRAHGRDGRRGGDRRSRHRPQGRLSRPAVPRGRAGRDRMAASRDAGGGIRRQRRGRLRRLLRASAGAASTPSTSAACSARSPSICRSLRHQGLADLAVDRLRLGRERDPARRRGDPPRRNRRGAVHRHRRLGQSGSADPLLAAVGAVDPERSAGSAAKPFSKNRDGFVMAEGAGALVLESLRIREGARREDPRRDRRLRRDGGFVPPHPLEPGRQADHRLHPQRHRRCRARRPTTSTTSTRTAPARRRTTRWNISASPPCSASAPERFRSRRTSR